MLQQAAQAVERERQLKEMEKLYLSLKQVVAKQPGAEIQSELTKTQRALAMRRNKMKVRVAKFLIQWRSEGRGDGGGNSTKQKNSYKYNQCMIYLGIYYNVTELQTKITNISFIVTLSTYSYSLRVTSHFSITSHNSGSDLADIGCVYIVLYAGVIEQNSWYCVFVLSRILACDCDSRTFK